MDQHPTNNSRRADAPRATIDPDLNTICIDSSGGVPLATPQELRELAEDIVRFCPALTLTLLGMNKAGRQIISDN